MICAKARCSLVLVAALAAVASHPFATLGGNIYPTNLSQSSALVDTTVGGNVTLGYLLNGDATGVTVQVLNSSNTVVRTINPGAQLKGSQSVVWDGKDDSSTDVPGGNYSFRVNTTGAASAAWTPAFSTDSTLNNFELPRGVAVNKNPNSPYYGRVYVSNGRTSSTAGPPPRVMSDGMYMLNADLSATGIPGGTGPHTAGISWPTGAADSGGVSPFRLQVGPDDSVYITDWSDAHSGLWQATPNLSGTAVEVLDSSTGRAASGLTTTHGSIPDAIIVGTGASRTIYTVDEDFIPSGGSTGSVPRYDIGNTTTFSGAPSGFAYVDGTAAATNKVINLENSIALDNNGKLWLSQNRFGSSTDTLPSLMQIDPATGGILWASVPNLAANSLADPLRGIGGIAYDPLNNLLALVTRGQTATGRSGLIMIFDPVSKTILQQFQFGGRDNNDVAFDNAGNLYVTNQINERMRIFGPPTGGTFNGVPFVANQFSTDSLGPLGTILVVVPEPASGALFVMGLIGLLFATRRSK